MSTAVIVFTEAGQSERTVSVRKGPFSGMKDRIIIDAKPLRSFLRRVAILIFHTE